MTTAEELALQIIIDRCNEQTWRIMRAALLERDRLQEAWERFTAGMCAVGAEEEITQ